MTSPLDAILARLLVGFAKAMTGARGRWVGAAPMATQRVYYANHASHGDFLLVWAGLPRDLRARTRPVAGADYWLKGRLRTYVATKVLNAVLIERGTVSRGHDPIAQMATALARGDSLIVFPEGTRNTTEALLLPFKSGLFHLAARCPDVEFVPVWIGNSRRVMPKGTLLPVPLLCTLTFGAPLAIAAAEARAGFLARAQAALLALMPPNR